MIGRRPLLLGAAGVLVAGPSRAELPVPADGLSFRVLRSGDPIGTHALRFERAGDDLLVRVAVDLAVRFGPFTVFRYTHRATERWRGEQVVALAAETNDDGDTLRVTVSRTGAGLEVDGPRGRFLAPGDALPATHWNRRMLDGPMINTQTGALMRPQVTRVGVEVVTLASGAAARAEHFTLSGDAALDTWYDEKPSWMGVRFTGRDGSEVRYERS